MSCKRHQKPSLVVLPLLCCCSAKAKPYIASMGIYVMKANALKELLEQHMPDANDFGNEVIPGARKMGYGVQVSTTFGPQSPNLTHQATQLSLVLPSALSELTSFLL